MYIKFPQTFHPRQRFLSMTKRTSSDSTIRKIITAPPTRIAPYFLVLVLPPPSLPGTSSSSSNPKTPLPEPQTNKRYGMEGPSLVKLLRNGTVTLSWDEGGYLQGKS